MPRRPRAPSAASVSTPCAGDWQRKADYPFPVRSGRGRAARLGDIFAGSGSALSAVKYDPAANQWSALTAVPCRA